MVGCWGLGIQELCARKAWYFMLKNLDFICGTWESTKTFLDESDDYIYDLELSL